MNNILPYLLVSCCLFAIGFSVVVTKKNLILMLMGVELMLNAVNINFIVFSKYDPVPEQGQIFTIFIMLVAAAEIALGLAIILKIREYYQSINPDSITTLKN
jgi:NADH:ubiquinone oxidoreductase subunit K